MQLVGTTGSQTSLLPHAAKPTSNIQKLNITEEKEHPYAALINFVKINGNCKT